MVEMSLFIGFKGKPKINAAGDNSNFKNIIEYNAIISSLFFFFSSNYSFFGSAYLFLIYLHYMFSFSANKPFSRLVFLQMLSKSGGDMSPASPV